MMTRNLDIDTTQNLALSQNTPLIAGDICIVSITTNDVDAVSSMIRRNLANYEEHGSVLAATFRRLADVYTVYLPARSNLFVAKDMNKDGACIGCAGTGPFHGLSPSEGVAEIRDLVVENEYRGQGIGRELLIRCMAAVKQAGYQRVYLETTPQMKLAQKLFMRNGFRAVTEAAQSTDSNDQVPCYFLKDDVQ